MNIAVLKAELLAGHPDTGAYSVDDAIAADQLNALNRVENKTSMTGAKVFRAVDKAEFIALSTVDQRTVWDIAHLGELDPFGISADLFTDIFTGGGPTLTALAAIRKRTVSRATEIGIGPVRLGEIQQARA